MSDNVENLRHVLSTARVTNNASDILLRNNFASIHHIESVEEEALKALQTGVIFAGDVTMILQAKKWLRYYREKNGRLPRNCVEECTGASFDSRKNYSESSKCRLFSVFVSLNCTGMQIRLSYCQLSVLYSDTYSDLLVRATDRHKSRGNLDEGAVLKFQTLPVEICCFKSDKERLNESYYCS
jgi:hypothetical protein